MTKQLRTAIITAFLLTTVTGCFELTIPVTPDIKNGVKTDTKTPQSPVKTEKTGIVDKWQYGNQVFIEANGENLISPASGTIEFKADGTFKWSFTIGQFYNDLKGTYTISGNKLTLNHDTGDKEELTWSIGKDDSGEDWLELRGTTGYGSTKIDGFTRVEEVISSPAPAASANPPEQPSTVAPSPVSGTVQPTPAPSQAPVEETKIKWSEAKKTFFEIPYPPMVLLMGDELKFGGLDLTDMSKTDLKAKADIRFEGEYLYSRGLIELNETLIAETSANLSGYLSYVKYAQGKVYLTVRADGTYAKIKIDRVTPSRVDFSYVLEVNS